MLELFQPHVTAFQDELEKQFTVTIGYNDEAIEARWFLVEFSLIS